MDGPRRKSKLAMVVNERVTARLGSCPPGARWIEMEWDLGWDGWKTVGAESTVRYLITLTKSRG